MALAPLRVSVEIAPRGGGPVRVFRLSTGIADRRLRLATGLPDELDWTHGPLSLEFHLPGGGAAITCDARAEELVLDGGREEERAERAELALLDLTPEAITRIEHYIDERLQLS
jgi:hypothetical protein